MNNLFDRTKTALSAARTKYGYTNQILVAVEELNELSCVLTKYPRYGEHDSAVSELRERVLEECGDVFNALDHVQAIFGITDEEIVEAAARKGDRLTRWLQSQDEGQQVSTIDRDVPAEPCSMCVNADTDKWELPCRMCRSHPGYKAFCPVIM